MRTAKKLTLKTANTVFFYNYNFFSYLNRFNLNLNPTS